MLYRRVLLGGNIDCFSTLMQGRMSSVSHPRLEVLAMLTPRHTGNALIWCASLRARGCDKR